MKKILLVDDSALMRRVFCDILKLDGRFFVEDEAVNGVEALELLSKKEYDGVILDVNMPKMDGLQLLRELQNRNIKARVLMASTTTNEGSKNTLDALELGALDFIHKPDWSFKCKDDAFKTQLLGTLEAVCNSKITASVVKPTVSAKDNSNMKTVHEIVRKNSSKFKGEKIVAIAVSTGGPRSLQNVIPYLPADLNAPVVIVQHMPQGFTESFAERLDSMSEVKVCEGKEGEIVKKGCVYIAKAGLHLNLVRAGRETKIHYTQESYREGVRPCANYMYESLIDSSYDEVVSVVMTGMGADGTEGIRNLKNSGKATFVITQDSDSCVVYGMPKACDKAGLSDESITLTKIAQEIVLHVGVKSDGC